MQTMEIFEKAIGSVSNTWNSINPATLSGAIDIIVVQQENGDLACSPFHVRFGKFQLLRPHHRKVQLKVNDVVIDLPMKVGDGGESFFVFETQGHVPSYLLTSPISSPLHSPVQSTFSSRIPSPSLSPNDTSSLSLPYNSQPSFDFPNPISYQDTPNNSQNQSHPASPTPSNKSSIYTQNLQLDHFTHTQSINNTYSTSNTNIVMDMTGYKSGKYQAQQSKLALKKIIAQDFANSNSDSSNMNNSFHLLENSFFDLDSTDSSSNDAVSNASFSASSSSFSSPHLQANIQPVYAKTLRLTSDQLKSLNLRPGVNDVTFTVLGSNAQCAARMFYWKYNTPVVISDIDGTITKSDALGHVLAMFGKDWIHPGVTKLFTDIESNGYHIVYLTARSVGQADSTKYYLKGISQDGYKLPDGPVILSPDRTMTALKREVIMKKAEVFKIACLRDIKNMYGDLDETPFYAGFGNRITDALSYRSVAVPSSRIFSIKPNGDVSLELLELSGYKSSYLSISDLVDNFFPPVGYFTEENTGADFDWKEKTPELGTDSPKVQPETHTAQLDLDHPDNQLEPNSQLDPPSALTDLELQQLDEIKNQQKQQLQALVRHDLPHRLEVTSLSSQQELAIVPYQKKRTAIYQQIKTMMVTMTILVIAALMMTVRKVTVAKRKTKKAVIPSSKFNHKLDVENMNQTFITAMTTAKRHTSDMLNMSLVMMRIKVLVEMVAMNTRKRIERKNEIVETST